MHLNRLQADPEDVGVPTGPVLTGPRRKDVISDKSMMRGIIVLSGWGHELFAVDLGQAG
jgi:hypothetical protein